MRLVDTGVSVTDVAIEVTRSPGGSRSTSGGNESGSPIVGWAAGGPAAEAARGVPAEEAALELNEKYQGK